MSKQRKADANRAPGLLTQQVVGRLPSLTQTVVEQFHAEPCPPNEEALRTGITEALVAAVDLLVADAGEVLEALPKAARASFDRSLEDFHVAESIDAVIAGKGPDLKDLIIRIIRLILRIIPKKYEWLVTIIEAILGIIEALQKKG